MHIPAFSMFSALSELFVTAGVLYVIRRNWTRKPFPFALFLTVAIFEAAVNVFYMSTRASMSATGATTLAPAMRLAFAAHGMLSLFAYLVFVILGVLAYQDQKQGRFFFPEHAALTGSFLVVWAISIVSGEGLFVSRYLL